MVRIAAPSDLDTIAAYDAHIGREELALLLGLGRVLLLEENGRFAGWLRYGLFWDNTPFMNLLFVLAPFRGKGYGRALVARWEEEMRRAGYRTLMTSTASDECAQHFYQRLGYRVAGGFTPPEGSYELLLIKEL